MRAPWSGSARILDGKACAAQIKAELRAQVEQLHSRGIRPGLGTILVGNDPASASYVAGKHKDCSEIGLESIRITLPEDATESDLERAICQLNERPDCTGYIVQLPLPKAMNTNRMLELISPDKDADGLHPINLGRLVLRVGGQIDSSLPCTPRAVIELGQRSGLDFNGKTVCVIGRGTTVGRSLGLLLGRKDLNATVINCHTGTRNLADLCRIADVLVCAAGVPGLVKPDMVKEGAAVFDVGVSRITDDNGKSVLSGDVADGVDHVAGWLSPNPGGVGPMTRALLLLNVVQAAQLQAGQGEVNKVT